MPQPSNPNFDHFRVLATDYDGTIASFGAVADETIGALRAVKESGRGLVLDTGRRWEELSEIFPHTDLFDWLVLENGAHLLRPADGKEILLGEAPPSAFVQHLHDLGVHPLDVGNVIVATTELYESTVRQVLRDMGLSHQIIHNKGDIMLLPPQVTKATGLERVLEEMGATTAECIGIGDAENDRSLLHVCGLSVAVGNALPSVKELADIALEEENGTGVRAFLWEMIGRQSDIFASSAV